jgi:uncharacterized membrane protein
MEHLEDLFSFVCGQQREHIWTPGGLPLPVCQRCTGLYVGIGVGTLLRVLLRFRSTAGFRWIHAVFLVQMVPFGFHLLPHGPVLRGVTGYLFGLGVVTFVGALPFERGATARPKRYGLLLAYALGAVAGLLFLPLAELGGTIGWHMLSVACLGGLLAAIVLVLWSASLLAKRLLSHGLPHRDGTVP